MTTMAAVRVHAWGEPPLTERVSAPEQQHGEALVRIDAAAVGHLDRTVAGGGFDVQPQLPYIGGVEGCGTIISSATFATGTRVMLRGGGLGLTRDGTWAEVARVPEKSLMTLPDGMGPALGATYFVPLTTAAAALRSIGRIGSWEMPDVTTTAEEVVVVAGAGGAVGSLVAQLALRAGARVLGLVRDEEQAGRLPAGVEALLANDIDRARELRDERPATLLVDTLGGSQLADRTHWVRPGGRSVLIGYVSGDETVLDLPNWLLQDVALLPTNMIRRSREARQYAEELAHLLVTGELTLVVEEFGFDDAATVFDRMAKGGLKGRAVLRPTVDQNRSTP